MAASGMMAGVTAALHGLRKLAITRLLDWGAAPQMVMVMVISSHTSFQELQKYVGTRDRRALAIDGASNSYNNMNSKPLNSELRNK